MYPDFYPKVSLILLRVLLDKRSYYGNDDHNTKVRKVITELL